MDLHVALLNVFVRSQADELVGWRTVSRQWNAVITSPDLLLERRRLRLPIEPLIAYNPDLLFGSPAGTIACYYPVDTPAPQTQPPVVIVAAAASSTPQLNDDATHSILLRCRATDLVLWRRVCRQWRDIISSPGFVLEYRDLQAPAAMLMLRPDSTRRLAQFLANPSATASTSTSPGIRRLCIESVELEDSHTNPSSVPLLWVQGDHRLLNLHASLDSVLLISYNGHLFAVNSVTRRGVRLPPIHTDGNILALFRGRDHEDYNPEYCVLYCNKNRPVGSYRPFSTATRNTVRITCPAPSKAVENTLLACMPDNLGSPLVIQDVIYWLQSYSTMILSFDTNFSQFNLLHPPPTMDGSSTQLLEMNGVLSLTAICINDPHLDIWVQQPEWHRLFHIKLPRQDIEVFHSFDFYEYYVVSADGQILVDTTGSVLHFDSNGVLLGRYEHAEYHVTIVPHQLKKILLPLCR